MIAINELKLYRIHFDSVLDAVNYVETTPYNWTAKAPFDTGGHHASKSWTLGHDAPTVLRLARNGWEEGVREVDIYARPPANARTNSWKHCVGGDTLDIGRYIHGVPTCMRRRANVHGRRPVVSLFVNNWINGIVTADQMVKFGAALVAAIDNIEQSGKRVELTVGCVAPSTQSPDRRVMSATWTVKRAEDALDLGALAFSIAHPGASRRFGWRIWGCSKRTTDAGFGVAVDWAVKPEHLINPAPDLLIIPGLNGHWNRCKDMADATALAMEQINKAAGEELVTL